MTITIKKRESVKISSDKDFVEEAVREKLERDNRITLNEKCPIKFIVGGGELRGILIEYLTTEHENGTD